tara:strand:- start:380 stop:1807 length:1428 start_codon:yes stop_codon:yes gene_type:complete
MFAFISGCSPETQIINEFKKISILNDLKNATPLKDLKNSTPLEDVRTSLKQLVPERPSFQNEQSEQKSSRKTPDLNIQGLDPRLAKILESPALIANVDSIDAAQKAVSIIESQREPLVTGTSNIGPRLSDDESIELDATGGVSVTKILRDGGALDALAEAAELNIENVRLTFDQSINRQLFEVLKAELSIVNFGKIKAVYDEQVQIYNENQPLIETAVKANVISKTEALKLQQLKIKSDERYLGAKTAADAAELVRSKFSLDENYQFFDLDLSKWKSFNSDELTKTLSNYKLLDIQSALLGKDIAGIEASFDPKVSLAGSATANVTNLDNSIGFLGLNITLPLRDGGKRNFEIEEKKIQISSLEQQKEEILRLNATAHLTLLNFETIYESRIALLDAQLENSEVIATDMELKLKAGAVSVADLATEKMNYFDLKSQIIALQFQRANEILNYHQALGYSCSLINLCNQVKSIVEVD